MDEVNTGQFIETIQEQGCNLVETIPVDGEIIHKVISRMGTRRVTINATEETMHINTANELLILLELEDLIGFIPTV